MDCIKPIRNRPTKTTLWWYILFPVVIISFKISFQEGSSMLRIILFWSNNCCAIESSFFCGLRIIWNRSEDLLRTGQKPAWHIQVDSLRRCDHRTITSSQLFICLEITESPNDQCIFQSSLAAGRTGFLGAKSATRLEWLLKHHPSARAHLFFNSQMWSSAISSFESNLPLEGHNIFMVLGKGNRRIQFAFGKECSRKIYWDIFPGL